jgi:hypothetical protein
MNELRRFPTPVLDTFTSERSGFALLPGSYWRSVAPAVRSGHADHAGHRCGIISRYDYRRMTFADAISLAVRYTLYRYSMRVFTSYLGFGAVTFEMAISIDIVEVTDSSSVSPIFI